MRGQKDINTSLLIDLYGSLLTEKQRSMLSLYFDFDYSLSEIAENTGISRQAVLDNIKHGESKLKELEASLQIKHKYETTEHYLESIENELDGISDNKKAHILSCIANIRAAWEE